MMKVIVLLFLVFLTVPSKGANFFHQMLTANFGMVNFNLTENASNLTGEDQEGVSTGGTASSSVFSFDLLYEFQNYPTHSLYAKATGPLLSSDNSGYFLGAVGANLYFNSLSSLFTFSDLGTRLNIMPSFRYYIGGGFGLGFLVYNLDTAKKSDVVFDIDIHAGLCYAFGNSWGIRAEVGASRGTGIATSSYVFKALVGVNMFLDTKNLFD